MPISGLFGTNIKEPVEPKLAPWYKGGTLFSVRLRDKLSYLPCTIPTVYTHQIAACAALSSAVLRPGIAGSLFQYQPHHSAAR